MKRPKPKQEARNNDLLNDLIDFIEEKYMNRLDNGEKTKSDFDHYVLEGLLKTIYGEDVFDWINKKKEEL